MLQWRKFLGVSTVSSRLWIRLLSGQANQRLLQATWFETPWLASLQV
ncbi:hypothetical protein [Pseudomonas asturiensis]|nr:hypothetical protein [Pseudomonas asturiensis]